MKSPDEGDDATRGRSWRARCCSGFARWQIGGVAPAIAETNDCPNDRTADTLGADGRENKQQYE
jgi:hypothetical protein